MACRFLWTGPGNEMSSQFLQTSKSTGGKDQAVNVFLLYMPGAVGLCAGWRVREKATCQRKKNKRIRTSC